MARLLDPNQRDALNWLLLVCTLVACQFLWNACRFALLLWKAACVRASSRSPYRRRLKHVAGRRYWTRYRRCARVISEKAELVNLYIHGAQRETC